MAIVINSNPTATAASNNLSSANDALRKSLARLSSGYRIVSPEDDAGGLAVAYKLSAQLKRNHAIKNNVQNGISFLQVQDAALTSAGTVVSRMAELRAMAQDVTKNTGDIENYSKEFLELQMHLAQLYRESFHGVSIFAVSGSEERLHAGQPILHKGSSFDENGESITKFSRRIYTHDSGRAEDGNVSIGVVNFQDVFKLGALDSSHVENFNGVFSNLSNANNLNGSNYPTSEVSDSALSGTADDHVSIEDNAEVFTDDGFLSSILFVSMEQFTEVINRIADARAENGAEQSRLMKVDDFLSSKISNLEAAHGRIMDVDVALESSRLARNNVLVQSSAAMVAQANQLTSIALTILTG